MRIIILLFLICNYSNCNILANTFADNTQTATRFQDNFQKIIKTPARPIKANLQNKNVTIAFATPLKQNSDYWRRSIQSFEARMKELKINYKLYEFSTAIYEKRKAHIAIQKAMLLQPDYLVTTISSKSDEITISNLLAAKNTKVIIQNLVEPLEKWRNTPPFMYVGFSHRKGTKMLADKYKKIFAKKEKINFGILYFLRNSPINRQRGLYFTNLFKKSKFTLTNAFYTKADFQTAKTATAKILKKQHSLDFIYACSTDIALGAISAIKDSDISNPPIVNGWGGGSDELKSIAKKDMAFTVMRLNDDNGVAMAEAIKLNIEAQKLPKPIIYSGSMKIIDQNTTKAELKKIKEYAFRYSNAKR